MPRILVIDDDDLVVASLRALLTAEGHQIDSANNGRDGLDAITAGAFDLVICDVFMPEMDGFETIRAIHDRDPNLPVLVMSGFMFRNSAARAPNFLAMAVELGAAASLAKPFQPDELLAAIDACLGSSPPETRRPQGRPIARCGPISQSVGTTRFRRPFAQRLWRPDRSRAKRAWRGATRLCNTIGLPARFGMQVHRRRTVTGGMKSDIRVLLLESVNESAVAMLAGAGYTNVTRLAKALEGVGPARGAARRASPRHPLAHPSRRGGLRGRRSASRGRLLQRRHQPGGSAAPRSAAASRCSTRRSPTPAASPNW